MTINVLYAFPEPLPIPRARGVQVAHALDSLARAGGVSIRLAYVPTGGQSPLVPIGRQPAPSIGFLPLSRSWPAPLSHIPLFSRWHSVRFFAGRLIREIGEQKPDAIYIRHLKLAARILRGCKVPLVYEAHEVFADTAKQSKRQATATMEAAVVRDAAGVVCNSQATADRLIALYGPIERLMVLPNGVTPLTDLPQKSWENCRRYIVYAGSFFGWKGVADLVAAAAELEGFHITLIGGEPEQIERLRATLPTTGASIEILPRLPHGEVMERVAASCIAVLPNRPDPDSAFTSPIKLFEYMAAGCAVVASDLPSIREILGPDEAVWFEAGNPARLAAALRSIGSDCARAKAMGERLREKSAGYTWDGRARKLKAFLEEIVAAKSAPQ